ARGIVGVPADGDVLQDRYAVTDDGERADDDAGGVIEEDRGADTGGRMDADLQPLGGGALHPESQISAAALPEPVLDAPGLQGDVALEVQERRQQRRRRGIVMDDALEVEACGFDEFR